MTKLLYDTEWLDTLKDRFLLLDTCVLIELTRSPELQGVFAELNKDGCRLVITADVRDELLRGAKTLGERKRCEDLIANLMIAVLGGIDQFSMSPVGASFQMVLRNISQDEGVARRKVVGEHAAKYKPSLIDERLLFLTLMSIAKRTVLLATSNYSDVPLRFYENESVISISDDGGLRSIGIYRAKIKEITKAVADMNKKTHIT